MLFFYIAAGVAAGAVLLVLLAVRPRKSHPDTVSFLAWEYAHRGLFTPDSDVPENSRAAFARAVEQGYGIELDVHLSADGQLFVMHDAKLDRTTDGEGFLADKTAKELSLVTLRGTDETLPRFEEVLDIVGGRVPLLIELKTDRGNQRALTDAVMAALRDYRGACCFESFDPRTVYALRRYPQAVRGQLSAHLSGKGGNLPWCLDVLQRNLLFNFITRPDFIAYRHSDVSLGLRLCRRVWQVPLFYWTVTDKETLSAARDNGIACIFEGFDPTK